MFLLLKFHVHVVDFWIKIQQENLSNNYVELQYLATVADVFNSIKLYFQATS